jgi:hypothetical protein
VRGFYRPLASSLEEALAELSRELDRAVAGIVLFPLVTLRRLFSQALLLIAVAKSQAE